MFIVYILNIPKCPFLFEPKIHRLQPIRFLIFNQSDDVIRAILRHEPTEPGPRAMVAIAASSRVRSQLSLNKIIIRIISMVKCYFRLYSPQIWEFRPYINWLHVMTVVHVQVLAYHHTLSFLMQLEGGNWSSRCMRL
ncbi:hypothetical protein TNCV_717071 [Trichonephila clavipes]|nr:hypothetical protein TNCV_717071 [Trichonephila clavipes]